MSIMLNRLLAQSATMYPATVALSPESVTVLLYASGWLGLQSSWLDTSEDPMDEITPEDWDEIEKLVANAYREIMTPIVGWCFPVILGGIPDNCLALDGSTHAREDYPLLYELLDDVFVLDADSFFLPDLRSRTVIGSGAGAGLSSYAVNETGGEETHTLNELEMPTHSHSINMTTGAALSPGELPVNIPVPLPLGGTNVAGGGFAHNNIQPFTALPWAVVAR